MCIYFLKIYIHVSIDFTLQKLQMHFPRVYVLKIR